MTHQKQWKKERKLGSKTYTKLIVFLYSLVVDEIQQLFLGWISTLIAQGSEARLVPLLFLWSVLQWAIILLCAILKKQQIASVKIFLIGLPSFTLSFIFSFLLTIWIENVFHCLPKICIVIICKGKEVVVNCLQIFMLFSNRIIAETII